MDTDFKTDSTYTIIKGKFKATASSSFGLIIVFMDNVNKNIERFDIVSSHFSTVFENNVNMPWNELEDMIMKMKWKGEYATNLTHDIQNSLEDLFEPGTGRTVDIWHALKKSQLSKTCSIFEEYLMRPTGDKNVKVEIGIETINRSDIEKVKKMREMKDNKELINSDNVPSANDSSTEPSVGESAVVLDISILLSPISGIPLMDLKQGDKVLIKISEETSRGQYFIDLFNASQDGEVLPIPATVEQVSQSGKYYTLLTQIGPGIYGKAISEDNVKAKKYDPALDKRKNKNTEIPKPVPVGQNNDSSVVNPDEEKKDNKNLVFFIIGGAILLLLLLILILAL